MPPRNATGGVTFDRGINEFIDLGEGDNFVELGGYLLLLHAQDGAVEKDVLAVRPRPDREARRDYGGTSR